MAYRVLFISNGHGEDNDSSHIIKKLRELAPEVEIAAMPIVGEGNAYRRLNVPIIGPTQKVMPSGGFSYVDRWLLLKDIQAGLLGLTWKQYKAIQAYAPQCDLIHATGDSVGQSFAFLTGKPFTTLISCLSALYEGTLKLDIIMPWLFKSDRCLQVFTKDPHTAKDLQRQGFQKTTCAGIPFLDYLKPMGKDLRLRPNIPMVALLPGSRLPEAGHNLKLELQLTVEVAQIMGMDQIQFRAALVPELMKQLPKISAEIGWNYEQGKLSFNCQDGQTVEVYAYDDAFEDILCGTNLVIGMAGLAVEQAAAIGKPIIQLVGKGPQFTYAFAEAQNRLIGLSAQTIGTKPATPEMLKQAAACVVKTLNDEEYLRACEKNGRDRLGTPGASDRIARFIIEQLKTLPTQGGDL